MRILQVVHSFPPHNIAGTEKYTYSLCKVLSRNRNVSVFYRICELRKREYRLNHYKLNGLNIFTINNTFRFCDSFEKFYKNDDIAERFIKTLDEIKPDIVHIQHLIFLSSTIIVEIKKRKIPIVFTLHDYWLICPRWHFLKKDFTTCDNNDTSQCLGCLGDQLSIRKMPKRIYLTLRNIIPGFLLHFLKNSYVNLAKTNLDSQKMLEKIMARTSHIKELCSMVDLFIAPSQFLRRRFIEFGISEDKIKFMPHGINTGRFEDFKRKKSDKIRFGFIGTILPAKGLDILINAFNLIKDYQVELKIYGKLFPYRGFEYYPRLIKRLARNKNTRFMGKFDHKRIGDVFSQVDVLVVPSIWYENSPLVIQEAHATKTPVIASNIGGISELIEDGVNGFLFKPKDVGDLYRKINLVMENPSLIENIKQNIKPPKDIEQNAKEIENIYEDLIRAC